LLNGDFSQTGRAEVALAEFIRARTRRTGPRDPAETLVTDILIDYVEGRGPKVRSQDRIAYAVEPLAGFWAGRTLTDISDKTTDAYGRWRAKSPSTVRRELGVLGSGLVQTQNAMMVASATAERKLSASLS
jgi:hypothetical protein